MTVRRLSTLVECVHTVVYFAPEPLKAYADLGLRGYWRGYFASRAAPLGTPSAELVTTLFGGFAPGMVARAIPEVWGLAQPAAVLDARESGATAALRRLGLDDAQEEVRVCAGLLSEMVERLDLEDRPMAAALAALPNPTGPLAGLWSACSVLRELRGDAHLAVLATYPLAWPRPHLLLAGAGRVAASQREHRGWSEHEWEEAANDLRARGLYGSESGLALTEEIEQQTDRRTESALGGVDYETIERTLTPLAQRVAPELPFPNPMGLTRP